jgi:hypothetical protein
MPHSNKPTLQVPKVHFMAITLLALIVWFSSASPCKAQCNNPAQTVLVVKRLIMQPGQTDSIRTIFRVGDKLKVRDAEGNLVMGLVTAIHDSVLTIKDKQVKISQIISICRANGITVSIVGGSIVLTSLSAFFTIFAFQSFSEGGGFGMEIIGVVMVDFLIAAVGFIPTVIGIIQQASTKHFAIGEKWELTTSTLGKVNDRF